MVKLKDFSLVHYKLQRLSIHFLAKLSNYMDYFTVFLLTGKKNQNPKIN